MTYVEIDRTHPTVAVLRLNRPERLNALSPSLAADVHRALAELRHDREVRAIVLCGAGRSFCAGYDLAAATSGDDPPPDTDGRGPVGRFWMMQAQLSDLVLALHECPKPTIAAVSGAAVGGGLALALACDLRVAAPDARFGAVFIGVGLTSCDMGVSYFLPRIVGVTRAADLMLTGRHFGAEEAERMGMLNAVSEAGAHVEAAVALGASIAQHTEFGVTLTKSGMWANVDAPSLRHAIELENRSQALGNFTGNLDEFAAAFVEKRTPDWKPF